MATKTFKTKQQIEEAYAALSQQYNSLLDKNQNDLIKIKQKEKTFNQTIQALKASKDEMQKNYKTQIDTLILQIDKMKHGLQVTVDSKEEAKKEDKKQLEAELASNNKQIHQLKTIIELKAERVEHLQENVRKMMDENIDLTQKIEKSKILNKTLENRIHELESELSQARNNLKKSEKIVKTYQQYGINTEEDIKISEKQHNQLMQQFNDQIRKLTEKAEQAEKKNQKIKQRLRETNEQLKRFMERDKKNNAIIKKKNEQIENFQKEIQLSMKKVKGEKKRMQTQETCGKCKEWQQENKLLKEMVKSLQTMVRVREMEAERYRNREALNNSKVHEQQTKRSRGELPPLKKHN